MPSPGRWRSKGRGRAAKTETARQRAASEVRLDVDETAAGLARVDPSLLLEGPTPRLIDEWQVEPRLWNAVRRAVDDRPAPGQFLLTGSATLAPDARRHSGAGRMARVQMRPMSLWESKDSTGDVSLAAVAGGEPARGRSRLSIPDYARLIVRGGWPELVASPVAHPERFIRNYLTYVVEHAVPGTHGPRHDPVRMERFLRS